ncbi:hypothetical protein FACS1894109_02500 [Spirochaetia bacterium]|nr:hypothetical protein FACS1894109_02500 [Spirochaetia bacterium]
MIDYYEILGTARNATQEEIKKAYKSKMRKNHPDKYNDPAQKEQAEDWSKLLNKAYETLKDDFQRSNYDLKLNSGEYKNEAFRQKEEELKKREQEQRRKEEELRRRKEEQKAREAEFWNQEKVRHPVRHGLAQTLRAAGSVLIFLSKGVAVLAGLSALVIPIVLGIRSGFFAGHAGWVILTVVLSASSWFLFFKDAIGYQLYPHPVLANVLSVFLAIILGVIAAYLLSLTFMFIGTLLALIWAGIKKLFGIIIAIVIIVVIVSAIFG